MKPRIRNYLRQQHLALLALVLVIGGGTAVAASVPRDSVTSRSVKDNVLKSNDLKDGRAVSGTDVVDHSLTGTDVTDQSLTGVDVADSSVSGIDVADNSVTGADIAELTGADLAELTGADIAESTLGQVPSALNSTISGIGRYNGVDAVCDPESTTYVVCTSVSITLQAPARLLVLGRIRAQTEDDSDTAAGTCRIGTTSGALAESTTRILFQDDGGFNPGSDNVPLLAVTGVLPGGTHGVGIDCNQEGAGAVDYRDPDIAVLAISPG